MQEYDFTITYCKGLDNTNADVLLRKEHSDLEYIAATTQLPCLTKDLTTTTH